MLLLKPYLPRCAYLLLRSFSSVSNLVNVNIDGKGVAVVEMNRPPVNSLNYELLKTLHGTLVQLETDRCKGMILTSSLPSVFSAGLDIMELYKPTVDKARSFWRQLQDLWITLYSSPYPSVAAINGHSPAGGCLLALSCEYRIIVPKVKIGLNETQLGIIPAQWMQECMRNVIGERQAEKALVGGTMFSSEEALRIGLVDEIVSNKEESIKQAYQFLEGHLNLPTVARRTVKLNFRKESLSKLINGREEDINVLLEYLLQPNVQQALEVYIQSLKKK